MKVILGTDHAGFEMKELLRDFLDQQGYEVIDKGAYAYNQEDDYTDFIAPVAEEISLLGGDASIARGIILGGSGQGEAILANKFPHVRAVVYNGQYNPPDGREIPDEINLSREHNDSNILALGARFLNGQEIKESVEKWLTVPFSQAERHVRRLQKVEHVTKMLPNISQMGNEE